MTNVPRGSVVNISAASSAAILSGYSPKRRQISCHLTRNGQSKGIEELKMSQTIQTDEIIGNLVGVDHRWKKHETSSPGNYYKANYRRSQLSNESLEKYVVLRQRSFHGLQRSKQELKKIPQTDPRDNSSSPDTWVHKSRTDIYIEKRQFKKKQKNNLDLNGITLRFLVNTLPECLPDVSQNSACLFDHEKKPIKVAKSAPPASCSQKVRHCEETAAKFPPLIKYETQTESNGIKTLKNIPNFKSKKFHKRGFVTESSCVSEAVPLSIWQPHLVANGFSIQEMPKVSPRRYFIETGASV